MKLLRTFLLMLMILNITRCGEVADTLPDMNIDMSTKSGDLAPFDFCDYQRIDKSKKAEWKGIKYYFDCKLKTYCRFEFNASTEEFRCLPEVYPEKQHIDYFLDDKCENKLDYDFLINNGDYDLDVPINTLYMNILSSTFYAPVAAKDHGIITLYSDHAGGKCNLRTIGSHPITYKLTSDSSKWLTTKDFPKLAVIW